MKRFFFKMAKSVATIPVAVVENVRYLWPVEKMRQNAIERWMCGFLFHSVIALIFIWFSRKIKECFIFKSWFHWPKSEDDERLSFTHLFIILDFVDFLSDFSTWYYFGFNPLFVCVQMSTEVNAEISCRHIDRTLWYWIECSHRGSRPREKVKRNSRKNRQCWANALLYLSQFKNCYYCLLFSYSLEIYRINNENNNMNISFLFVHWLIG